MWISNADNVVDEEVNALCTSNRHQKDERKWRESSSVRIVDETAFSAGPLIARHSFHSRVDQLLSPTRMANRLVWSTSDQKSARANGHNKSIFSD